MGTAPVGKLEGPRSKSARAESWRSYCVCSTDLIGAGYAAAVALVFVSASTALLLTEKACVIADGLRFQAGAVLLCGAAVCDQPGTAIATAVKTQIRLKTKRMTSTNPHVSTPIR